MKNLLFFAFCSVALATSISGPAYCNQGENCSYVASGGTGPYTYSLTKPMGSNAAINSSTGVFTAQSKVTPKNQVYGWQVMGNNSIYTTSIANAPVDTRTNPASGMGNSDTWMANLGIIPMGTVVNPLPSFPINHNITSATTCVNYLFLYTGIQNGCYPRPPYNINMATPNVCSGQMQIENGICLWDVGSVDLHSISLQTDTGSALELYHEYPLGYLAGFTTNAQSGQLLDYKSFLQGMGTDAANLPQTPLIYNAQELIAAKSGSNPIQHMARVTFNGINCPSSTFEWPSNEDGSPTEPTGPFTAHAPCGAVIRLKAGYVVPGMHTGFCATTACQNVFNALINAFKNYGLVIADIGTGFQIQTELTHYDDDVYGAFEDIILMGSFDLADPTNWEFVDISSMQTSPSGTGLNNLWMEAKYNNSIQAPDDYAIVTACDTMSACASISVVQLGVAVGCPDPSMLVQAGAGTFQIGPCWASGATNTSVTCSLSPTGANYGSVTSGCLYTAPTSVTGKQQTTLTVTSVADGTVSTTVGISILPTGTLRINVGDTGADCTDGLGNIWYSDWKSGDFAFFNTGQSYDFSGPTWGNAPNTQCLYNHMNSGSVGAQDQIYKIWMAPGNYSVNWLSANVNTGSGQQGGTIDTPGGIVVPAFDYFTSSGSTTNNVLSKTWNQATSGSLLEFMVRWTPNGATTTDPTFTIPIYSSPGRNPVTAALEIDPASPFRPRERPPRPGRL